MSRGAILLETMSVGRRESLENGSRLKKRLDPERSEFAADAGVLESAERRLLIVQKSVDRDAAGEDSRGYATRAVTVRAPPVSVKTVLRIVGDPDRILVVPVCDDREDGPEDLFPGDCHIILHI